MRLQEKWFWLSLLCVFVVATAASRAHIVRGYLAGEAFYRGRPSSDWSRELRGWEKSSTCGEPYAWYPPIAAWEAWVKRHFPRLSGCLPSSPPILRGDPKALPVLVELTGADNPKVRTMAVCALWYLRGNANAVIPALRKRLTDGDLEVRLYAAWVLGDIEREGTEWRKVLYGLTRAPVARSSTDLAFTP